MGGPMNFEAVLLVSGASKELFPLVSKEVPKPLLPVGNRPLLAYSLELLESCGLQSILAVVNGEALAVHVSRWISGASNHRLHVEVVTVPEDAGTADALRHVAPRLTARDVLVMSADVVSDMPLGALAAAHRRSNAAATVLVSKRPTAGSAEGSAGSSKDKAKRTPLQDFLAMDAQGSHLLFFASGSDVGQQLLIRRSLLRAAGQMMVYTDLVDAQIYAFNRQVLQETLKSRVAISSIRRDLLPFLVRIQQGPATAHLQTPAEAVGLSSAPRRGAQEQQEPEAMVDSSSQEAPTETHLGLAQLMSHTAAGSGASSAGRCFVKMVESGRYCTRVHSLQSFADVNRDVAAEALHLTGYRLTSSNNVVHESAELGSKTTVGPQCIVGEGTRMGDKCSVKKSVVGRHCRIGSNVKIINSVVMDHVTISDGSLVQSSLVCSHVVLQEHSSLKDCQVGAGYTIGTGLEHRGEALARKDKQ